MAFGQLFVRTGCERENSVHTQIKPTDNSFLVDCISAHKEVKLAKCKMCISFHRSYGVDVKVCVRVSFFPTAICVLALDSEVITGIYRLQLRPAVMKTQSLRWHVYIWPTWQCERCQSLFLEGLPAFKTTYIRTIVGVKLVLATARNVSCNISFLALILPKKRWLKRLLFESVFFSCLSFLTLWFGC